MAQRKVYRCRNFLANGGVPFDLLPNGIDSGVRSKEAIGQRLVLAEQTEQQMLGFNVRAAELAGFVPREKYYPACFLRVAFKHRPYRVPLRKLTLALTLAPKLHL